MTNEQEPDIAEVERINDHLKRVATTTTYRYAKLIENYLWNNSKFVPAEDLAIYGYPGHHGERVRIFEGTIQGAGEAVGLSKSASSIAYALLVSMQATTTLRRATPKTTSIVLLSYQINEEQYEEFRANIGLISRRITPNKYEELKRQIEELKAKVDRLEKFARSTSDKLVEIEDRRMLGGGIL